MPFSATKRWVGLWVQYGLFQYPEWLVVGGAVVVVWVISVPRVLVVGGAVVVVWVISVPRVVGGDVGLWL